MARITAKQAKEMNEAYAKVHQNLAEETARERMQRNKERITNPFKNTVIQKTDGTELKQGDKGFDQALDNARDTVTKANNKSLEGRRGNSNNTQQSTQSNNNTQQSTQSNNNTQQSTQSNNNTSSSGGNSGGSGSYRLKPGEGRALMNKLKNQSGDKVQSSGGQQPQSGTPVNKLFGRGGSDGSPAPYTGGPNAAQRANAGTGTQPATGGQPPAQQQKPGLMGRLGSLAGRAAGAARNAASGIKQVATSAASNIKKTAGAVASGAKRVAGGVADAATGNMTDFDKRGGKPQGVARVVAGGIDKLTGDRTDLDKRGPSKPAQQPSGGQQQAQPTKQQAQPAQQSAKLSNNSPAAKAGIPLSMRQAAADKNAAFQAARKSGNLKQYRKDNPQLSGAERAKAMAKERIAAKKAAPAQPVKRKVTSVMDMEGYDPMENLFDDTVQFLVSEGHAKDKSEAISIMSESEFIEAFNKGLNEVLNEQSEG